MSYKLETNALHAGHDIKNTSGTRAGLSEYAASTGALHGGRQLAGNY